MPMALDPVDIWLYSYVTMAKSALILLKTCTRCPLVVGCVFVAWLGFADLQGKLLAGCVASCRTFSDYAARDPYCIANPACVSPLYKPGWKQVPSGQGLQWLPDKTAAYGRGLRMLSPTNYVIFMLLLALAATLTARYIRRSKTYLFVSVGVVAWCLFESVGWLLVVNGYDPALSFADYREYGLVFSSTVLIGATTYIARQMFRERRQARL